MAVIPQVDVSTRKIETSPSLHYFPSMAGENGRALGGAITTAANGLDRILEVKRRADEREAEYSVLQADNFVRNGWLGKDAQDPQTGKWVHTPGVADRNWEQMRDDQTTALDEMKRLQTAVREQKFYTDLSPEQRKVFDRKWIFKADQHTRTAQEHHQRLQQARIVDETIRTIEMRGAEVAENYGANDLVYTKIAGRNALLNWGDLQGTALNERSRALLDDPRCNFADIAKSQGWDERTKEIKFDQYRKVALGFDVNRISAFQKAAASGQMLGGYTPNQCADMADKATDGLLKSGNISEAEASAIRGETAKARQLLEGKRAATHKIGAQELAVEFKKRMEGLDDTRMFIGKTMQTREDYNKGIDVLLANDKIDERTAEEYKCAYGKLIDRRDYLSKCVSEYERTGKGGVWTRIKDRNGKEIEVFQPDRLGNGKTETDPTIAAKYTMKDRNGNTPYFNNPAAGMEELDYDLRMGNISVPFYNAQMAALRVYSDTKAKTAFVKIFGADATLFPDKDLPQYQKQGIDTAHKQLWAKNQWWAGNHNVGKNAATWQEDALKGDGGEYKVSLEQEAQICEMVLQLTAEGVDPTDAIQAYLAPTFDGWMKTDLSERLDPSKKIGGKTFRDWILESKRFGSAVGPRDREARLQARQKQAYEAK